MAALTKFTNVDACGYFLNGSPFLLPAGIDARSAGVLADGIVLSDVAISSGSAVADSASHTFTVFDIGKLITVAGAGASGGPLNTTIASVQSGNAVLSANATATVSNAASTFGTDDTAAWNNAVAQALLNPLGSTIIMPIGLSCVSGSITWYSKLSMRGFGAGKSILKWMSLSDMTSAVINMPSGSAATPYVDCQFQDFEIDCAAATQATYHINGKQFLAQYMVRPVFQRLYLHDSPATGLGTDYLVDAVIIGNVIQNCGRLNPGTGGGGAGIGIGVGSTLNESYTVVGNHCIGNKTFGIFFETEFNGSVATNSFAVVTGNYVECSATSRAGIGDCGLSKFNCTGNTIDGTLGCLSGIAIEGGTLGFNPGNAGLISSNVVNNCLNGIAIDYTIALPGSPANCQYVIEGNRINGSANNGISINANASQLLSELVIRGNTIAGSSKAGIGLFGAGGMKNVTIQGNDLFNNGIANVGTSNQAGIQVGTGCNIVNLRVINNVAYDDQTTATQQYGLGISNSAVTGAFVSGNDFSKVGTQGIILFGTGSLAGVITNNPGYNPQGALAVTPAASPWTYTAGNTPEVLYLTGGTVSAVVKSGITLATASPCSVALDPGEAVTVTYSVAPTAAADRK